LVGIEIPGIPLSYQEAAYMVTQMYISMEVEDLSKKINENQKKMAELQQDREMALMRDRELEKVKLITNPMTMEVTSVELDGPYEPISGPYHTGNICKTTVFPMYFGK
jgi:peroxiredoxin family protein